MAEYEVHLYGTWRRGGFTYDFPDRIRFLNRQLKPMKLKGTLEVQGDSFSLLGPRISSGTFELMGDVKAKTQADALKKAEQTLKRTMRDAWCSPPAITVE